MPFELTVLLGDAGTGKTERLLVEYRAALTTARREYRIGTVLWLAPTHRAQQSIIERLLDAGDPVQMKPNVLTFDGFAEQVLAATGQPATQMSPVMKRLLLRRIVADLSQQKRLNSFASVTQTTGFLDVISAFISELKREEIWPEQFLEACSHRPPTQARRDEELGLIYARYQQCLTQLKWYDNEGRFWLARNHLADGRKEPFETVELLVVDGFADFTRTQHEILGLLTRWIPRALVSLPCEAPMTRPELFDKTRSTIRQLREHLPDEAVVREEMMIADRTKWPAGLRVTAASLFANPRSIEPAADSSGLEIIAATGPLGEAQAVALRIKNLLLNGRKPSQIVVAVRSVQENGQAWQDYFEQAGIPSWCEAGTPLGRSPLIKALFSILQMELEDWPFPRVTQVLGSNYFQPGWPELSAGRGIQVVGAALRRLKLHSGRELTLRVLERVATGATVDLEPDPELQEGSLAAVALIARDAEKILQRLSKVTERLRGRKTLADWGDIIASLGRDLGWGNPTPTERPVSKSKVSERTVSESSVLGRGRQQHQRQLPFEDSVRLESSTHSAGAPTNPVPPLVERDSRDWDLLQRILRKGAEADQSLVWMDSKPTKQVRLDLAEFTAELRDLLGGEQIKAVADSGGQVRILDVEQARHLDIPDLFLVGLSESSFPMNRGEDCLFDENERREFANRGLPLQHREMRQRDEMVLFYSTVTRARRSLTLSYPAVNPKGQPVFASPYLAALRSLFTETGLKLVHEGQLDPVPTVDRALTETDLRLLSIATAKAGSPGLFATLAERSPWRATGRNIQAAMDVNLSRFHEQGFTNYEGRLCLDANIQSLAQRFGSRHQFSATELEAYATCPFRFWLASVLRIGELDSPEHGTDYAARGSLIHIVLARMLREGLDKPENELASRFSELVEEILARQIHETELQRALTRIELRLLTEWGEAFARQQIAYQQKLSEMWTGTPSSLAPEIPFGDLAGSQQTHSPQPPSSAPLDFESKNGTVLVRGRIDRVDTGFHSGKRVFNVIDYKTGSPPSSSQKSLEKGQAIQLALYALAVQRLGLAGPDAIPYQLGYWSLKATGFKRGYQKDSKSFDPMKQELIEQLGQTLSRVVPDLAQGIRNGKFLVLNDDENCTAHCEFHTACRVNQIRPLAESLNKTGDILTPSAAGKDDDH